MREIKALEWIAAPHRLVGVIVYIGVMSAFFVLFTNFEGDRPIITYQSGLWHSGLLPYRDFTEVNLPMNMLLYQPAFYIGDWLNFSWPQISSVQILLVFLTCFAISTLNYHILSTADKHPPLLSPAEYIIGSIVLWVLTVDYYAVAEREYLMMMLISPYILRFAPAILDAPLSIPKRVLTGVLAGIGFCIKPHSILFWLAISIYHVLRTRSVRPLFLLENLTVYTVTLIYFAYIIFALPDYLHTILPLALEFYGSYEVAQKGVMISYYILVCFILIAASLVDFKPGHLSPYSRFIPYFFSLITAGFVYIVINQGWSYTATPTWIISIMLACFMLKHNSWVIFHSKDTIVVSRSKQGMYGLSMILAGISIAGIYPSIVIGSKQAFPTFHSASKEDAYAILKKDLTQSHVNSFAILSTDHFPWYTLAMDIKLKKTQYINHFWMMPEDAKQFERMRSGSDPDWKYRYVMEAAINDIRTYKPDAIFVSTPCAGSLKRAHFDVLGLLLHSKEFSALWKQYRFTKRLMSRVDPGDGSLDLCSHDMYIRSNP